MLFYDFGIFFLFLLIICPQTICFATYGCCHLCFSFWKNFKVIFGYLIKYQINLVINQGKVEKIKFGIPVCLWNRLEQIFSHAKYLCIAWWYCRKFPMNIKLKTSFQITRKKNLLFKIKIEINLFKKKSYHYF